MKAAAAKPAPKARVLVVDDHPFLRAGLAMMISKQPDMECAGEAENVATTQKQVSALKPDLLMLDLCLGDGDGLELIKSLHAQFPKLLILVLSSQAESEFAERVLRAGAQGYILKEKPPLEVLAAARAVLAGELHVSPQIAAQLLRRSLQDRPAATGSGVESLTDRELQVFRLLGTGLSTRRIAEELKLSFKTIETYRENIKHKLGLPDATALLTKAAEWVHRNTPMPTRQDVSKGGAR